MLQVLVSIQALILNAEPYYNEPGYAFQKSNSMGSSMSDNYSENTFLLSLKTMLYTMRNPPKVSLASFLGFLLACFADSGKQLILTSTWE